MTKNKLETQRREVDTKINAASGQRFLINVPRDREELRAAYETGNPSRANDRHRRADLLLRPRLALAAAHQRQESDDVARSTQLRREERRRSTTKMTSRTTSPTTPAAITPNTAGEVVCARS
jgi:hypothetical protein